MLIELSNETKKKLKISMGIIIVILLIISILVLLSKDGEFTAYKPNACVVSENNNAEVTCGPGRRKFTRQYIPAKIFGKDLQNIDEIEKWENCGLPPCKIDGRFTEWTNSGECKMDSTPNSQVKTCRVENSADYGKIRQTRNYIDPQYGGLDLPNKTELTRWIGCDDAHIPLNVCRTVDESCSAWIDNTNCTCNNGVSYKKQQTRTYTAPENGGVSSTNPDVIDCRTPANRIRDVECRGEENEPSSLGRCPANSSLFSFSNPTSCTPETGRARTQKYTATYTFPVGTGNEKHNPTFTSIFTTNEIDEIKNLQYEPTENSRIEGTHFKTFTKTGINNTGTYKVTRNNNNYPNQYTIEKTVACAALPYHTDSDINNYWSDETGCTTTSFDDNAVSKIGYTKDTLRNNFETVRSIKDTFSKFKDLIYLYTDESYPTLKYNSNSPAMIQSCYGQDGMLTINNNNKAKYLTSTTPAKARSHRLYPRIKFLKITGGIEIIRSLNDLLYLFMDANGILSIKGKKSTSDTSDNINWAIPIDYISGNSASNIDSLEFDKFGNLSYKNSLGTIIWQTNTGSSTNNNNTAYLELNNVGQLTIKKPGNSGSITILSTIFDGQLKTWNDIAGCNTDSIDANAQSKITNFSTISTISAFESALGNFKDLQYIYDENNTSMIQSCYGTDGLLTINSTNKDKYLKNWAGFNYSTTNVTRCGPSFNNTACPDNKCCSTLGFCGTTTAHCTSNPGPHSEGIYNNRKPTTDITQSNLSLIKQTNKLYPRIKFLKITGGIEIIRSPNDLLYLFMDANGILSIKGKKSTSDTSDNINWAIPIDYISGNSASNIDSLEFDKFGNLSYKNSLGTIIWQTNTGSSTNNNNTAYLELNDVGQLTIKKPGTGGSIIILNTIFDGRVQTWKNIAGCTTDSIDANAQSKITNFSTISTISAFESALDASKFKDLKYLYTNDLNTDTNPKYDSNSPVMIQSCYGQDGILTINSTNKAKYLTTTTSPAKARSHRLYPRIKFLKITDGIEIIRSPNNLLYLFMNANGTLSIIGKKDADYSKDDISYPIDNIIYNTGYTSADINSLEFDKFGNLSYKNSSGTIIWQTNTGATTSNVNGNPTAYLELNDLGDLLIKTNDTTIIHHTFYTYFYVTPSIRETLKGKYLESNGDAKSDSLYTKMGFVRNPNLDQVILKNGNWKLILTSNGELKIKYSIITKNINNNDVETIYLEGFIVKSTAISTSNPNNLYVDVTISSQIDFFVMNIYGLLKYYSSNSIDNKSYGPTNPNPNAYLTLTNTGDLELRDSTSLNDGTFLVKVFNSTVLKEYHLLQNWKSNTGCTNTSLTQGVINNLNNKKSISADTDIRSASDIYNIYQVAKLDTLFTDYKDFAFINNTNYTERKDLQKDCYNSTTYMVTLNPTDMSKYTAHSKLYPGITFNNTLNITTTPFNILKNNLTDLTTGAIRFYILTGGAIYFNKWGTFYKRLFANNTNTSGDDMTTCIPNINSISMEHNGNLVFKNYTGGILWSSETSNNDGAYLELVSASNDENRDALYITNGSNDTKIKYLFDLNTILFDKYTRSTINYTASDRIARGYTFKKGMREGIAILRNGNYTLSMLEDGKIYLYGNRPATNTIAAASETIALFAAYWDNLDTLSFNEKGILIIRKADGTKLYSSDATDGEYLVLTAEGSLLIVKDNYNSNAFQPSMIAGGASMSGSIHNRTIEHLKTVFYDKCPHAMFSDKKGRFFPFVGSEFGINKNNESQATQKNGLDSKEGTGGINIHLMPDDDCCGEYNPFRGWIVDRNSSIFDVDQRDLHDISQGYSKVVNNERPVVDNDDTSRNYCRNDDRLNFFNDGGNKPGRTTNVTFLKPNQMTSTDTKSNYLPGYIRISYVDGGTNSTSDSKYSYKFLIADRGASQYNQAFVVYQKYHTRDVFAKDVYINNNEIRKKLMTYLQTNLM